MSRQRDDAAAALEALEAIIRQRFAKYTRSLSVNEDVTAILAAAENYRDAPAPFTPAVMHLKGAMGGVTACRYRWRDPGTLHVTRNTALVTCGKCRRSVLYRGMTGGRPAA